MEAMAQSLRNFSYKKIDMTIEMGKHISRRTFLETAAKFVGSLAFASGKLHATARANEPDKEIDDLELYDFVMPRVRFAPLKRKGSGQ